jgi:8-oxo-dGTP pyrophosphatase MutT (NUDIX family)
MLINEDLKFQESSQSYEAVSLKLQPGKIIDFLAARRALFEEARVKVGTFDLDETLLPAAGRSSRRVHLPDPLTDALLLLVLATAVLVGLLAISSLG